MATSLSDFNEVEQFDVYNPHPYQGGYDIAATYGIPLRPSSAICYPISLPHSPAVEPPPSHGEERLDPAAPVVKESDLGNGSNVPSYAGESERRNGPVAEDCWRGYGIDESRGSGSGHLAAQPYQELYGDWPFPAQEIEGSHGGRVSSDQDLWSCAADYFFGYLHAYGEKRDERHTYGNLNYAYERHQPQEPLLIQLRPREPSWYEIASHHEDCQEEVYPQSGYAFGYGRDSSEVPDFEIARVGSSWSPTSYHEHEDYSKLVYPESECSYAYERHHYEQPLCIQQEQIGHISNQNPSLLEFFESHAAPQAVDMHTDGSKPYELPPSFIELFESHVPSQLEDVHTYGSKRYEQPLDEVDFIEKTWCQLLNYNQTGETNLASMPLPCFSQCDESWDKSDDQSYFPFHKYSDYDD